MAPLDPRALVVSELREQLKQWTGGRTATTTAVSTGVPAFDALLPAGGWQPGGLVEWLAPGAGSGATTLALLTARAALAENATLVIVDEQACFYPLSLLASGIDLGQLVLVRPGSRGDAHWAMEQALRCRGVAVTLGWLDRTDERVLRRLQLAAETGGGLGLLLRPAHVYAQPAWADLRLLAVPVPGAAASRRRWRIEILACRGGASGGTLLLEACHETGLVHLAPALAPATPARAAHG